MTNVDSSFAQDGNVTYPFDVNAECTDIHSLNSSLQCLFATTAEDCVEVIEHLDYNYFVFCYYSLQQVWPSTIILLFWLLMLFIALGVTSNYFLCPALFTISNHLGLSQNVAGVTLLAFGNASPDIFSSVAGLQKASAELAIASLIGAGVFVTGVVAGSVFLTQSFSLMIRPFLRDITFYFVAIMWTFALFFTDRSYVYHGIGFVALYFVYIMVVIGSRFIYVKRQKKKEKCDKIDKSNVDNDSEKKTDASVDDPDTLKINGKVCNDDDGSTAVVLKAFYFGGFEWLDGGGRRLSRAHMFPDIKRKSSNISCIANNGNTYLGSCQSIQSKGMASTEKLTATLDDTHGELWDCMVKLCPINTKKWPQLIWYKRIIALTKSPAILIMRLTVPVLDTSEEDMNWNRFLICIQCVTGPIFISLVSEYAFYMIGGVFPVFILLIAVSACCSVLVYCTSESDTPPTYHWLFAYLGFGVAVTWIYCLANEIVALLQVSVLSALGLPWTMFKLSFDLYQKTSVSKVIGVIFNLSDAILGLTILAWGNSISDFLSNIAVARKNYPRMAISACYGGPLLALLLGLGIPCIIEIVKGRVPTKFPLMFSPQFAFLFATIGTGLVITAVLMSAWKFQTRRAYGAFLILLYITFVTGSVLEELKIFSLNF